MNKFIFGLIVALGISGSAFGAPTEYCSKTSDGKLVKVSTEDMGSTMNLESWAFDNAGQPTHGKSVMAVLKTAIVMKGQMGSEMVTALTKIVGTEDFASINIWLVTPVESTDDSAVQITVYSVNLNSGHKYMFWLYEGGGIPIGSTAVCAQP